VGSVSQILVFYTYGDSLEGYHQVKCVHFMLHIAVSYVQPSMPPLPVAKNRPLHIAGSHSSKVMLERVDVGIDSATRHRSAETT
jgi:hypothetical protein